MDDKDFLKEYVLTMKNGDKQILGRNAKYEVSCV